MKNKLFLILELCLFFSLLISFDRTPRDAKGGFDAIKFYTRVGRVNVPSKFFLDTVTATTGNGMGIDISAAGFTKIMGAVATAEQSTASAEDAPIAVIKSISLTSCTVNIVQGKNTAVSVLSLPLTVNGSQFHSSPSSVRVHLFIYGD